jgi:hypothetical protein
MLFLDRDSNAQFRSRPADEVPAGACQLVVVVAHTRSWAAAAIRWLASWCYSCWLA